MSKMRFFALQELANRRPLEVITPSNKLSDYYGSHVFDRKKMQEYLLFHLIISDLLRELS